jgi:alpha-N-arabinofuranosidase
MTEPEQGGQMNRRNFLKKTAQAVLVAKGLGTAKQAFGGAGIPAPRPDSNRAHLTVVMDEPLGKLNRNILGSFTEHLGACIYDGIWVGPDSSIPNVNGIRKDTSEALKRIQSPIVRWPGGCFADTYHWRDGIGPRDKRPTTWNMFWGREESNAFGTDEFMEFCRLSGSSPYICINVGSGTVEEAVDWFQYCNGKEPITLVKERTANGHADPYNVKYWSIGNESWGCGGNFTPEDYANRYAEFTTYLSSLAERQNVEFVAVGLEGGDWNRRFFETLASRGRGFFGQRVRNVHQLSIHHYYRDGAAVEFSDKDYYDLLGQVSTVEGDLRRTIGVIDEFTVPQGPTIGIALDEWGVWHPIPNRGDRALFQPNTLRDALLAAVTLNSINSFGTRVSMANIAQTFNVLQSLAFTQGSQMVLTPTYYVFDLFQPHMDATGLKTVVDSPTYEVEENRPPFAGFGRQQSPPKIARDYVSVSASLDGSKKKLCLTLVNQHLTDAIEVEIELAAGAAAAGGRMRELTSASVRDQNTFEHPDVIKSPQEKPVALRGRTFTQTVPAHSLQSLVLDLS